MNAIKAVLVALIQIIGHLFHLFHLCGLQRGLKTPACDGLKGDGSGAAKVLSNLNVFEEDVPLGQNFSLQS